MKFSTASLAVLAATSLRHADGQSCVVGGFTLQFDGECSYNNVLSEYNDTQFSNIASCPHTVEEDLKLHLGLSTSASSNEAEKAIRTLCEGAWNNTYEVKYADIAREFGQFEQIYYNGGTYWNEEVQTNLENADGSASNHLRYDARYVRQFYASNAQTAHVEWPDYLTNFDPDTCEINAAYCCWPQDRQANDNNGNCNDPYDENCYDKDPADNTDLCYVDLTRSPKSNSFGTAGSMLFPFDNGNGEGAIHCHGFAWSNDKYDFTSRYKSNNLFYVSMYDHMTQRGYVRNIPGAPMCACAEQMPTVSRSDCTQIDVDETYVFEYNDVTGLFSTELTAIEIDFNSCRGKFNKNNDLWYYFLRLQDEGKVTADQKHALNKYLVGNDNCKMTQDYTMNQVNFVRGYKHDETSWTRIAGRDSLYEDPLGQDAFLDYFQNTNQVVRRVCATCISSHQDIYYKRLTPIPEDMNLLHYLLNSWTSENNEFNIDFKIYSSFEDAENDENHWTFCNFNSGAGFPYECGPNEQVRYQWSRFHSPKGRTDVAFYLQAPMPLSKVSGYDVGNTYIQGSSYEMNGKIYVTSSGSDIWGTTDHFHYGLATVKTGDATLQVYISKHNYVDGYGRAGVMMRQTESYNSPNVYCYLTGSYGVIMSYRSSTGSRTDSYRWSDDAQHTSIWLRLEKRMNTFTCKKSTDGSSWATIYEKTLNNWDSSKFETGLAVASHKSWVASEAVFEKYTNEDFYFPSAAPTVSSAPSYVMAEGNNMDIGNVRNAGSATVSGNNAVTITAYGYDIWSGSDQFHYVFYEGTGNLTAVVKVDMLVAARTWTKAGLMFRESLDEDSKFMDLILTGGAGVVTQYRPETGSDCTHYSPNSGGDRESAWLKLEKIGNTFQSYRSLDGKDWIKMGNAITLEISTNYYVGMALVGNRHYRAVARFTDYSTY